MTSAPGVARPRSEGDKRRLLKSLLQRRRAPLTRAQRGVWLHHRLDGDGPGYNMRFALQLDGPLCVDALLLAFSETAARHPVLRVRIDESDIEPSMVVEPPQTPIVPFIDLTGLSAEATEAVAKALAQAEGLRPFDLAEGPLWRQTLIRMGLRRWLLVATLHHIVGDGWSIGLLACDVMSAYSAFADGREPEWPPAASFLDYAHELRERLSEEDLALQRTYWRERLGGAPELLTLPWDRTRSASQARRSGKVGFHVPAPAMAALQVLCRRLRATLFAGLLAAYGALLARYSGQRDLVIGSPYANRDREPWPGVVGCFVQTLAYRLQLGGEVDFAALIEQARDVVRGGLRHRNVAFEELPKLLGITRRTGVNPVFQAALSLEIDTPERFEAGGLRATAQDWVDAASPFDLGLFLKERDGGLRGVLEYDAELFDHATVARMARSFLTLLEGSLENPGRPALALPIFGDAELAALLAGQMGERGAWPPCGNIANLFDRQASMTPARIALVWTDGHWTYAALRDKAGAVAEALRKVGPGGRVRVGVCAERSPALATALLGALYAGVVFTPLDPSLPAERLRRMAAVARLDAVLIQGNHDIGGWTDAAVIDLDAVLAAAVSVAAPAMVAPDQLAYLMFTSGSTGEPKAVMVSHRAIGNRLLWAKAAYPLQPDDRFLVLASFSFDIALWELFAPLIAGATAVLAPAEAYRDPAALARLIEREAITQIHFVPSLLAAFVEEPEAVPRAAGLRRVFCGGEALPAETMARFRERFSTPLIHFYGPTEAAINIAAWTADSGDVSLGRPIANAAIYVLDARLRPAPPNVAGALFLGGAPLARGYAGRPDLTAAAFVPDPFSELPGGRLYQTRDLGRWTAAGQLQFLGRADHQLKLRGFRIEPGEIENALRGASGVADSLVTARALGAGEPRLIAYVVTRGPATDAAELRAHLSKQLPGYMIPAFFVFLERWPLNPNGKIDRRALPAPAIFDEARTDRATVAPRDETETRLAGLWADILGIATPGVHDNFFELGGDSILAIQLSAKARELGMTLEPADLMARQTVADLAELVRAAPVVAPTPELADGREDRIPASPMQQGMLYHALASSDPGLYAIQADLVLEGALAPDRFREAWRHAIQRHECLRAAFAWRDEERPMLAVRETVDPPWRFEDWRGRSEALDAAAARELAEPFDLERAPLMRLALFRVGEQTWRFLWTVHHAVIDGWSIGLVYRDAAAAYTALSKGQAPVWPKAAPRYRDYLAWLHRQDAGAAADYWREALRDIQPTRLGDAFTGAERQDGDFVRHTVRKLELDLSARLGARAKALRTTPSALIQAAWSLVLAQLLDRDDVLYGLTVAGRPAALPGAPDTAGLFINTVPARVRLDGDDSLGGLAGAVHESQLARSRYECFGLTAIRRWAALDGDGFDHILVFENQPLGEGLAGDSPVRLVSATGRGDTHYPLTIGVFPGEAIELRFSYRPQHFSDQAVERLLDLWISALNRFADAPDMRVGDCVLVADQDRVALPTPEPPSMADAGKAAPFTPPRNEAEATWAAIWKEVLGVARIGVHDRFFELGGDSILSIQVVARARRAGFSLSPRDLFERPTIAQLAATVPMMASADEAEEDRQPFGLTPIQLRLLDQNPPNPHHFNQAFWFDLARETRPGALAHALAAVWARHGALRLRFDLEQRRQRVVGDLEPAFAWIDLDRLPEADRRETMTAIANRAQTSFHLADGPVARVLVFGLSSETAPRLWLGAHHLVVDGVSWRILLADLETAYVQAAAGAPIRLAPPPLPLSVWSAKLKDWSRNIDAAIRAFWLRQTEAASRLPRDGDPEGTLRHGDAESVDWAATSASSSKLARAAGRLGAGGAEIILLAGLWRALARWTGERAFVIDLESHGREPLGDGADPSETVGWFTALFPLRIAAEASVDDATLLTAVAGQRRAVTQGGLSYGALVQLANGSFKPAATVEIGFNYLGRLDRAGAGGLLTPTMDPAGPDVDPAMPREHLLEASAAFFDGALRLRLQFSPAVHRRGTAESLLEDWGAALPGLVEAASDAALSAQPTAILSSGVVKDERWSLIAAGLPGAVAAAPPTPAQLGMLFHTLEDDSPGRYAIQVDLLLEGALDPERFRAAWRTVVQRHEALRAAFVWRDVDAPVLAIYSAVDPPWRFEDRRGRGNLGNDVDEAVQAELNLPFELDRPPLTRFALLRLDDARWRFVWTSHHAVIDGWSFGAAFNEALQAYAALAEGAEPLLPQPRPYRDFLFWREARDMEAAARYWRQALSEVDGPTLLASAFEKPRQGTGAIRQWARALPAELTVGIQQLARSADITLSAVMQAAWSLTLCRLLDSDRAVHGLTVSGRPPELAGSENMIGLFINTIPVCGAPRWEKTAAEWLGGQRALQAERGEHEHSGLTQLRRWAGLETDLFDHILVFENQPLGPAPDDGGSPVRVIAAAGRGDTHYPLTIGIVPGAALTLEFSYRDDSFSEKSIERLHRCWTRVLRQFVEKPAGKLADVALLAPDERGAALAEAWGEATPLPERCDLWSLFAAQAAAPPERPALRWPVGDGETWRYDELAAKAGAVAAALHHAGVVRGDSVALCARRSPEAVAAMLGILRAGAVYVPIDPELPEARRSRMLQISQACFVIAADDFQDDEAWRGATRLSLSGAIAEQSAPVASAAPEPAEIAYIMFTSGSTGEPKAVAVSHGAIANRLLWAGAAYPLQADDRFLQLAGAGFDIALWEQFAPLIAGAVSVLAPPDAARDAETLANLLIAEKITQVHFVPSLLAALLDHPRANQALGGLRRVFCGGEAMSVALKDRLLRESDAALIHFYGPTEAAINVTAWDARQPLAGVSLGRPIANCAVYALDRRLEPVVPGCAGELCLGGAALARGYIGNPAETAVRFIPDPFAGVPGARLYRSGDRGRWTAAGWRFLGRVDEQIKLRGHRIEPAEIEAALRLVPGVADARALAATDGGAPRLIAFLRPADSDPAMAREYLQRILPAQMIPARILTVAEWPLTANGKLDRKELLALEAAARREDRKAPPQTPAETVLAAIWQDVLGVANIGARDNFFELGGDSILSIQVVARARQAGLNLTPRDLFERPVLAEAASAATVSAQAAVVEEDRSSFPPTPAQARFLDLSGFDRSHFNQAFWFEPTVFVDAAALAAAWAAVAQSHGALRARFSREGGTWQARVVAEAPPFQRIDLGGLNDDARECQLQCIAERAQRTFDLVHGPVARAIWVDRGASLPRLWLGAHHLAVDGVSWRLLLADLALALQQVQRGEPARLPAPPPLAAWTRRLPDWAEGEARADRDFWRDQSRPNVAALPRDFETETPSVMAEVRTLSVGLDRDASEALLRAAAKLHDAGGAALLAAGLWRALAGWTGQRGFRLQMEGHGREALFPDLDASQTVGWLTALYPVHLEAADPADAAGVLAAVAARLRGVPHGGVSYGALAAFDPAFQPDREPEISFNYLGRLDRALDPNAPLRWLADEAGTAADPAMPREYTLDALAVYGDDGLMLRLSYSPTLHRRETILALAKAWRDALPDLVRAALDGAADPAHRTASAPLSFAQKRVWLLNQLQPSAAFNMPGVYRLSGELDETALENALQALTDRHDELRARFARRDGEPVQIVEPVKPRLAIIDASRLDESAMRPLLARMVGAPFDLGRGPLWRAALIRLSPRARLFAFTLHHAIADGWSLNIFISELTALFARKLGIDAPRLPRQPGSYLAFAERQRARDRAGLLEKGRAFWREQLAEPAPLDLPLDRPRHEASGRPSKSLAFELDEDLSRRLRDLAAAEKATPFMALLAGFNLMLGRSAGERAFFVGLPVAERENAAWANAIGLLVNVLPFRATLAPGMDFRGLLRRTRTDVLAMQEHVQAPFERAGVETLDQPLFRVVFAYQNAPRSPQMSLPGLTIAPVEAAKPETAVDLTLLPRWDDGRLAGDWEYDGHLFESETIVRLDRRLRVLLADACARPEASLDELDLLDADERRLLLADLAHGQTTTVAAVPHRRFEALVAVSPDRMAVAAENEALTRGQINVRANRLARWLRRRGVGPESLVALCLPRSTEAIVAIMAVWKAGGAYLPLDPDYPAERLRFMLADAEPLLLLGQWAEASESVWTFADAERAAAAEASGNLESTPEPLAAAYLIYTSGSTGRPKGAALTYAGLANMAAAQSALFGLDESKTLLQFAALGFDASVSEIATAFHSGALLRLAPRERLTAGPELARRMAEWGVTHVTLAPSVLAAMDPPSCLETVVSAGEALPSDLADAWSTRLRLINAYGPTETAVCAAAGMIATGEEPTIGRPLANLRLYVLDNAVHPAPIGAPGELCVAGPALARGYLDRPEMTAARFVPDPFADQPGERLYRTGDRVRWRGDGRLAFLGRVDRQIKLRGFRIEPGEIETALRGLAPIRDAAVVLRELRPGVIGLVAFVAAEASDLDGIRASLTERLPEHMVPAVIEAVDRMPLTPSGKIDRQALMAVPLSAAPKDAGGSSRPEAVDEILRLVRDILAGALALPADQLGYNDHFFERGGHSLLAAQAVARLNQAFDAELTVRDLFEAPRANQLFERLKRRGDAARPPLAPAPRPFADPPPLSFAQQRIWFVQQLNPSQAAFLMPFAVEARRPLDLRALAEALRALIERHELLRTGFEARDGAPVQIIHERAAVALPVVDLCELDAATTEAALRALAGRHGALPFHLDGPPLLRVAVARLAGDRAFLLVNSHHIVSDGWSQTHFVNELAALYAAAVRQEQATLPALPVQYADYALWQRTWLDGAELDRQLDFWRERLAGAPPVQKLPWVASRPVSADFRAGERLFALTPELSQAVRDFGPASDATLFMTLTTAFMATLHCITGEDDMVLGTDAANRDHWAVQGLIGFFVNQLALRVDLSGDPDLVEVLRRVRAMALAAYGHSETPFEKVVEALNPARDDALAPLFQRKLVLQNLPRAEVDSAGLDYAALHRQEETKLDLQLNLWDGGARIGGMFRYKAALFEEAAIARLASWFEATLARITAEPELRLSQLRTALQAAEAAKRQEAAGAHRRGARAFFAKKPGGPSGGR